MNIDNERRHHIVLVIRHPVGGIRTYLKYVYNELFSRNYIFTIILPEDGLTDIFKESLSNIDVKYVTCKKSLISIIYTLYKILIKEKIDLVHSHGFMSGLSAVIPTRLFKKKHIMTAHDVLLDKQFSGIKGRLKELFIPYLFNKIDIIHAVSVDVENNIIEMLPSVKSEKIVTILNGIDISLHDKVKARNLYAELNLPKNYFLIGFLGRFMSQKGFRYLIDAVEIITINHKNTDFAVITIGSGGFIREEKEIIRRRGLEKYFIFLQPVSNSAPSIKGMNVVAIPSLWEACPLLPMEVLVLGIPLIASNCIGLREVIDGTPTFVVCAEDASSLATAIEDCMRNDRVDEFQSYRQIAMKRFDSMNTSRHLSKMYSDMIAR